MGAREPMHANLGTRVSAAISDRISIPLAVVQGVTGVLLILAARWDLMAPSGRWLLSSIVLYVIALGYATAIQRKKVHQIIELTSGPRPADAPPGPPPGAAELIRSIQRGGMLLTVLIVAIIALMVLKPTM
jgi:uncharacterized membrane protein